MWRIQTFQQKCGTGSFGLPPAPGFWKRVLFQICLVLSTGTVFFYQLVSTHSIPAAALWNQTSCSSIIGLCNVCAQLLGSGSASRFLFYSCHSSCRGASSSCVHSMHFCQLTSSRKDILKLHIPYRRERLLRCNWPPWFPCWRGLSSPLRILDGWISYGPCRSPKKREKKRLKFQIHNFRKVYF